jgi:hypothetical protein
MTILFDHGTPAPLRRALLGHSVTTAYEAHLNTLSNGALLDAAEVQFQLLITTDKSIRHQQNLSGRQLSILGLPTTNCKLFRNHLPLIASTVDAMKPGEYREMTLP